MLKKAWKIVLAVVLALLVVVLGGTAWIFVYSFLVFKKIMR